MVYCSKTAIFSKNDTQGYQQNGKLKVTLKVFGTGISVAVIFELLTF